MPKLAYKKINFRASAKEKQNKVELELVKDNWHDAVDLLRDAGY